MNNKWDRFIDFNMNVFVTAGIITLWVCLVWALAEFIWRVMCG